MQNITFPVYHPVWPHVSGITSLHYHKFSSRDLHAVDRKGSHGLGMGHKLDDFVCLRGNLKFLRSRRLWLIWGAFQLEKKSSRKSSQKNFTSKSYNKKIKLDFRDDFHDDFRDDFFSIELGP